MLMFLIPALFPFSESSEVLIKRELITNGPMLACFVVYEEFQHYKSGTLQSNTFFKFSKKIHTRDLLFFLKCLAAWENPEHFLLSKKIQFL